MSLLPITLAAYYDHHPVALVDRSWFTTAWMQLSRRGRSWIGTATRLGDSQIVRPLPLSQA